MIDPKRRSCICGYHWYFSKWDYVRMLLFNGLVVVCPRCRRKHFFRLTYFANEDFRVTREDNKNLEDSLKELWGNG